MALAFVLLSSNNSWTIKQRIGDSEYCLIATEQHKLHVWSLKNCFHSWSHSGHHALDFVGMLHNSKQCC